MLLFIYASQAQSLLKNLDLSSHQLTSEEQSLLSNEASIFNQGSADDQFKLASLYYAGKGFSQNLAKALELYIKAFEQDHALTKLFLALRYHQGEGMPKESKENLVKARYDLALLYENGEGVA